MRIGVFFCLLLTSCIIEPSDSPEGPASEPTVFGDDRCGCSRSYDFKCAYETTSVPYTCSVQPTGCYTQAINGGRVETCCPENWTPTSTECSGICLVDPNRLECKRSTP